MNIQRIVSNVVVVAKQFNPSIFEFIWFNKSIILPLSVEPPVVPPEILETDFVTFSICSPIISAKFHNTMAKMVAKVCNIIREQDRLNKVVLSGGVFQNLYLLKRTLCHLRRRDFEPYIHHQVPCNDGGIALGQAVIANAKVTSHKSKRSIYVLSGAG